MKLFIQKGKCDDCMGNLTLEQALNEITQALDEGTVSVDVRITNKEEQEGQETGNAT